MVVGSEKIMSVVMSDVGAAKAPDVVTDVADAAADTT